MADGSRKPGSGAQKALSRLFLLILTLFLCSCLNERVAWEPAFYRNMRTAGQAINSIVLLLSCMYVLAYLVLRFGKWLPVIPLCILSGFVLPLFQHILFEDYRFIMTAVLALMACRKDYRQILMVYLILYAVFLMIGIAGCPLGLTYDVYKYEKYGTGHSLGLVHANTTARFLFQILSLTWYLYLRRRPALTFALFWLACLPVLYIFQCRTVLLLMAAFPFLALAAERASDLGKLSDTSAGRLFMQIGMLTACAAPFCFFALTVLLSYLPEWLQRTKGHLFYNLAGRFVQAGLAIRHYGLHLFGQEIDTSGKISQFILGREERLHVIDNAYAAYALQMGMLFMAATLGWLSAANARCLKNRDLRLLLLALLMLVYALTERGGLMIEYNYLFLYPLAIGCESVIGKN